MIINIAPVQEEKNNVQKELLARPFNISTKVHCLSNWDFIVEEPS